MSVLSLNKISYSYKNGKNILDDISIEFEKGKFYTILGVSGSGKTTLLSLLAPFPFLFYSIFPKPGKYLNNTLAIILSLEI